MKYLVIVLLCFSQTMMAMTTSGKKALIVTIDQDKLRVDPRMNLENGTAPIQMMLQPLTEVGALGQAITIFLDKLKEETLVEAWDKARGDWIVSVTAGVYDKVFLALGEAAHVDEYMRMIWEEALADHDVVDYVSMVHGGQQLIKESWGVPQDSKKIRMVYSEACGGGSGREHFIDQYGALISAGHNAHSDYESASPLFSFAFLSAWFAGMPFTAALNNAWQFGSALLMNTNVFPLAQLFGGYEDAKQALDGSKIEMAWASMVDPNTMTVTSMERPSEIGIGQENYLQY